MAEWHPAQSPWRSWVKKPPLIHAIPITHQNIVDVGNWINATNTQILKTDDYRKEVIYGFEDGKIVKTHVGDWLMKKEGVYVSIDEYDLANEYDLLPEENDA